MKERSFLNWLTIFVGLVAAIGLCFTPALANDGQGMLEEEQEPAIEVLINDGGDDILEESFGQNYQATWIPSADFTPYDSTTRWSYGTPGMRYITGGRGWMPVCDSQAVPD